MTDLAAFRAHVRDRCQGFSEPEAGSDLASLRTSAHRRRLAALVLDGNATR